MYKNLLKNIKYCFFMLKCVELNIKMIEKDRLEVFNIMTIDFEGNMSYQEVVNIFGWNQFQPPIGFCSNMLSLGFFLHILFLFYVGHLGLGESR